MQHARHSSDVSNIQPHLSFGCNINNLLENGNGNSRITEESLETDASYTTKAMYVITACPPDVGSGMHATIALSLLWSDKYAIKKASPCSHVSAFSIGKSTL